MVVLGRLDKSMVDVYVRTSTYVLFTVEALLCSGADACTSDSKGRTPLHFAVTAGNCTLGKVHGMVAFCCEVDVSI